MEWEVKDVNIIGDYILFVRFKDGVEGFVKFEPSFFRGAFSRLRDYNQFKQATVTDGVVTWPGELDLAPDAMYHEIKQRGEYHTLLMVNGDADMIIRL